MKLDVYGLKTCDTCRKALKALREAGFSVAFYDVRMEGVPSDVLTPALERLGADKLLNTRSTTWRGLSEDARARPPLDLLVAHPALMKRPLIVAGDWLTVGWSADIQAGLAALRDRPYSISRQT